MTKQPRLIPLCRISLGNAWFYLRVLFSTYTLRVNQNN